MNINFNVIGSESLEKTCDCVVTFVTNTPSLSISNSSIETLSEIANRRLEAGDLIQKQGKSIVLYDVDVLAKKKLMLIYVDSMEMTSESYLELCQQIATDTKKLGVNTLAITLDGISVTGREVDYLSQTFAEAILHEFYAFGNYKTTTEDECLLQTVTMVLDNEDLKKHAIKGCEQGKAVGIGKNLARDLGNMPPNVCHPTYLAEKALAMAENHATLTTTIVDEDEMESLGMMSFLSVGQGSDQPSKLIVMEYNNAPEDEKPYALVGKGITFDSGGISIKPGAAMDEMKFDMCGAASVFGAMGSVLQLQLPINLVCVVAAAENMPSSNATRPGDIIKSMSGKTIEVLNTDAEGRLVLCDALTFVQKYQPKTIIDIATLTGACIVALGEHASGLFSNDKGFANTLIDASERAGDKMWQLPIWPEYTKKLKSPFADLANIGTPGAGSITAACFLSEFVKDQTWAHLDIAGTAWLKGSSKGATGRPVAMLVEYLTNG